MGVADGSYNNNIWQNTRDSIITLKHIALKSSTSLQIPNSIIVKEIKTLDILSTFLL